MASGTATFTADFREEFEADRTALLRRRFMWWTGTFSVIQMLGLLWLVNNAVVREGERVLIGLLHAAVEVPALVVFIVSFFHMKHHAKRLIQHQVVRISATVILIAAVLDLFAVPTGLYVQQMLNDQANPSLSNSASWVVSWGGSVMTSHLLACLFLPWTPRESLRAVAPVFVIGLLYTAVLYVARGDMGWVGALVSVVMLVMIGVPGTMIAWWKHSRYRKRFQFKALRGRYGEMKRELYDAQKVHESLFPAPIEDGSIQVRYVYEPMRQIGGDFVYAVVTGEGEEAVGNIVVIDVTGHGITAALTVNRLYGEIRRELAEQADLMPGELLAGINAYIHNTLAEHSVYATALCMRVDPSSQEVRWASAGHPPAFMLGVDGTMHDIDSTTLVLGAARQEDFRDGEKSMRFTWGDRVVAYTDGATESRDVHGKMMGVAGIRAMVDRYRGARDGRLVDALMGAVRDRRVGPIQDDTLIVEVRCPVGA